MNLLKEQIKREERALVQDKRDLELLEDAFKSSKTLQKRQAKTLHPLACLKEDAAQRRPEMSSNVSRPAESVFQVEADDELKSLLHQLYSHLQSMQNNTASLRPISVMLHKAQSTLDLFSAAGLKPEEQTRNRTRPIQE